MSAVAASPDAVADLGAVLLEGSERLRREADALRTTLGRFAATRSEYGPRESVVPEILDEEASRMVALSDRLAAFVHALQAADNAGAAISVGRPLRLSEPDLLLADSTTLSLYEPLGPGVTMRDLLARAEAELAYHDTLEPPSEPGGTEARRRWEDARVDLVGRLHQYQALVAPLHQGGWAGVDIGWTAAADFLAAVERAGDQLVARLGEPGSPRRPVRRWRLDDDIRSAVRDDQPFLAAALDHGTLLTPDRLAIVDDLDRLVDMPLDEFVAARAVAASDRPHYDWTADGCSGPIPPAAQDTCLRHDFMYRNARMLRDQWGLPDAFALDVKEAADARFGDELYAAHSAWQLGLDPLLVPWLEAAQVAVMQFGDVSERWSPPPAGRFYGSTEPQD